ncbi:MAG TPA: CoA transferase [Polyangia bacterium]|nr:CoA transferase [Polyangia bacterium]
MKQPLDGIRILDLSRMLTGGFASMLLGDLGAEVIKIEPPGEGDPLRRMPPHFDRGESAYFLAISRNKKSVALDLRREEGRALFHRLVQRADVVFDNFRPGVLEKLGADFQTLSRIKPRIVCCSISAYGHTGPLKDCPGFDLVLQALSGMMSCTGEPGRAPVRMGAPMGDLAGSMFACSSICAALLAAERTGAGRQIELSLLDCLVALHTYVSQYWWVGGQLAGPAGSGHMSVVPYGAFRTADGFVAIAVFVEKFWQSLCNAVGRPELGSDPAYDSAAKRLERRAEVDGLLGSIFPSKATAEWMELLNREEVPAAPVLGIDEVLEHEQLLERGMVVDVPHPRGGTLRMLGNPVRQPGADDGPLTAAPLLGQHSGEILGGLLGIEAAELERLVAAGVI